MLSTISCSSYWNINAADIYLKKINMRDQFKKKKKVYMEKIIPSFHKIRKNESIICIAGKND